MREKEENFFIAKRRGLSTIGVSFGLALTMAQKPLVSAIKSFIDNYHIEDNLLKNSKDYLEIISKRSVVLVGKPSANNAKSSVMIQINQVKFLVDKFIPLLFGLKFVTKKYKDFLD